MMNLKQIHIFESRKKAFGDDNVLQENIILVMLSRELRNQNLL